MTVQISEDELQVLIVLTSASYRQLQGLIEPTELNTSATIFRLKRLRSKLLRAKRQLGETPQ